MSNPALSAGSDLNGLTTHETLRIGCIYSNIPRVALSE